MSVGVIFRSRRLSLLSITSKTNIKHEINVSSEMNANIHIFSIQVFQHLTLYNIPADCVKYGHAFHIECVLDLTYSFPPYQCI